MQYTTLDCLWSDFVMKLARDKPSAYIQIRKIFRNIEWEVSGDEWDGISFKPENLGYSAGPSKMNQLKRNYLNVEELEKARDSLLSRMGKSQSCVTARFGNREKDSRSQGFCMQTISLNFIDKPEPGEPRFVVELYYRSTEVGQKFLADLMFLDEVVFPILFQDLPEPDIIRFKFSTLYLSSMFLPIVMQIAGAVEFMDDAREDTRWFNRCLKTAVRKWLDGDCTYNYRTRANMHKLFREYVFPQLTKSDLTTLRSMIND